MNYRKEMQVYLRLLDWTNEKPNRHRARVYRTWGRWRVHEPWMDFDDTQPTFDTFLEAMGYAQGITGEWQSRLS